MTSSAPGTRKGFSAILGGSFDPIHLGHLHVGSQILLSPEIERLIFMPVRHHHFKTDSIIAGFETRLRLIRTCLQEGMEAWDTDGSGSGFSADLMKKLQSLHPEMDFLFVIGADNLPTLTAWYDFEWLRYNVQFLVIPRPEFPPDAMMLSLISARVLDIPLSPVSSSEVRRKALAGESLEGLVPAQIIKEVSAIYAKKR